MILASTEKHQWRWQEHYFVEEETMAAAVEKGLSDAAALIDCFDILISMRSFAISPPSLLCNNSLFILSNQRGMKANHIITLC
jgi:hypothetical protein